MATIKDVAARAGISYTTVSHVVNGTRPVSEAVRNKVQAAIAELGYVPSGVARSLRAQATGTLGMLLPNVSNPYFAELARGVEDHAEQNGYSVILCNSDDDIDKQLRYLRVLLERRIDGLIVATVDSDPRLAEALARLSVPLVLVDRPLEGVVADRVQVDHEHGGYLATQHLLALGHHRIACIAGPASTEAARLRAAGYQRALAEANVPALPVLACAFTAPAGHAAAHRLLAAAQPPSAIFAGNDMLAIGVLRAAAERGLQVPAQLSVVGFDDIEVSRYLHPALTTVGQAIGQLGERAAARLLARIRSPDLSVGHQSLPPQVVLRETSGPAFSNVPGPHNAARHVVEGEQ